nr:potassium transporter Kup [Geobacteraceae bacterium]
ISILRIEEPFGIKTRLIEGMAPGLDGFEIRAGYMEVLDLENVLKKNGIREKVIFYGVEDISSRNPIWKIFSTIKKQTPNFVQFYNLPASKLQGVVTRVEM